MITRKDLFHIQWNEYIQKGLDYSSNNIQSMYRLAYLAMDGMKDALTIPEKEYRY